MRAPPRPMLRSGTTAGAVTEPVSVPTISKRNALRRSPARAFHVMCRQSSDGERPRGSSTLTHALRATGSDSTRGVCHARAGLSGASIPRSESRRVLYLQHLRKRSPVAESCGGLTNEQLRYKSLRLGRQVSLRALRAAARCERAEYARPLPHARSGPRAIAAATRAVHEPGVSLQSRRPQRQTKAGTSSGCTE